MCITINKADLSKTKILSLALESGNHFIAYSNKVKNLSGKPNAMILPIPGETKQEWFHNTESYKDFLDEITKKCNFMEDYLGMRMRSMSKSKFLSFEEFNLGMYTVALAKNFEGIEEFIKNLPENKRPDISEELQNFFKEKYAGWSFAICAFDSNKTIDAQPIAFEYKPFNKDLLYFPTMDGHDGKAPTIFDKVDCDHTFIYEHTGNMGTDTYEKRFVTLEAKVPEFLQNKKYRAIYKGGNTRNADTYIDSLEMGKINFSEEPQVKKAEPTPYIIA